jgi:hypothetical protein
MGNYAYNIPDPADPWANQHPASKEEAAFDKLDAAGVLRVVNRAMATEQEKAAAAQFQQDEATFRAMYPSYRDTPHNANALKHHWENVLGVTIPSLEQIEESFFALRASGLLQLDAKAVAKENEEQILRRAAEIREKREAEAFNEDAAYALPMVELERRARGW